MEDRTFVIIHMLFSLAMVGGSIYFIITEPVRSFLFALSFCTLIVGVIGSGYSMRHLILGQKSQKGGNE